MKFSRVAKLVVAAVGAGVIALQVALTDGTVTASEGVTVALAVLTALGVYVTPNSKPAEEEQVDEVEPELPEYK